MKFVNRNLIEIDRELSDLDTFTIDFVKILKKYTKYVLVSGYVSILLGRSRSSEDVDIIIQKIDFSTFQNLYKELKKNGFYCINAEDESDLFEYLVDNLAIRFARKQTIIPNIEMKFIKNKFDEISLKKSISVIVQKETLNISPLELQIAFKEEILRSPKDLEDANHIRQIAKEHLDMKILKKYKANLHGFYRRKQKRS